MKKPSEPLQDANPPPSARWEAQRARFLGFGEQTRKNYYPQLRQQLAELTRFRALINEVRDAIIMFEEGTGRISDLNEAVCLLTGYTREALLELTIDALFLGEPWECGGPEVQRSLRGADGQEIPVEMHSHTSEWGEQRFGVIVARDIRERLRSEQALRSSEARLRSLFLHAPVGIATSDLDGVATAFNLRFTQILRLPPNAQKLSLLNQPSLKEAQISAAIQACLEAYAETQTEVVLNDGEGKSVRVRYHVTPVWDAAESFSGALILLEDVTETHRLESALRHAQKMQAVGTLAGGIAHDFNNALGALLGHAELGHLSLDPGHPVQDSFAQILLAGRRATSLVSRLLAFSRREETPREVLELRSVVDEVLALMRPTTPVSVRFELKIAPHEKGQIAGNRTQLHQTLTNLCTNAARAMPDGGALIIGLETRGREVRLSVADTGCGIPPEIRARIFEPYFTTRPVGQGTGLGLAMVHSIVKQHEGTIEVHSEVDVGTTFEMRFPLAEGREEALRIEQALPTGRERVLVVDDEPSLAQAVAGMLGRLGYHASIAASPEDALARIEADPGGVDLLFSDITMPTMFGDQLAEEARRVRPDLPIILCTGYSSRLTPEEAAARGYRFLLKPLRLSDVAYATREALDRAARASRREGVNT